jgi:hypothetical protein
MKFNELSHMMQKPEPKPDTYEAGMALNQLLKIGTHAIKIHNMIDDAAEMEAWVAKKIDLASNYVKSVHGYTAGSKAGTYDDDGMSEDASGWKLVSKAKDIAKKMAGNLTGAVRQIEKLQKDLSKNSSVKQALAQFNEDAGEQALANDIGLFFVKKAKEMLQSMERPNKNDQEYEEYVDIAQAFKKGIKAGLDQVNMSDFEFSNNPFGDFGRGIDDGPDEELVKILAKHGYQPGPDGANDKATIVRQRDESVSEDAGEGHMSKSQLYQTAKMAIELLDMINKGDDLEGWVQTKLNLAADYLQAVYHYEDYQKLNPYREELDGALMQKHAGVIQKSLDEILARETEIADVDTKPGMMRILKKRVNEVEKDIAKENRKNTDEVAPPGREKQVKKLKGKFKDKGAPYAIAWAQHNKHGKPKKEAEMNEDPRAVGRALANLKYGKEMANAIIKGEDMMLLRPKAQAFLNSADETINLLDKMYSTNTENLDEGIKDWAKNLAMAGIIVAGMAGVNTINNAIDNSVPAIQAMNSALEMAQDQNDDDLAQLIKKDLSDAKLRLDTGKDLSHVKDLQDKYAKFMKTEGLAYESKLAVQLKQRLK